MIKSLLNGSVVFYFENGEVVRTRIVRDDEHIASFNTLIYLAKIAGYLIVAPDGNEL